MSGELIKQNYKNKFFRKLRPCLLSTSLLERVCGQNTIRFVSDGRLHTRCDRA